MIIEHMTGKMKMGQEIIYNCIIRIDSSRRKIRWWVKVRRSVALEWKWLNHI